MSPRNLALVLSLPAFVAIGCGPSGPALFPVKGTVKKDGKPLSGVMVALVNVDQTKALALSGISAADGSFEILTGQGDKGAPEGTYKVTLTKSPGAGTPADMQAAYSNTKADPSKPPGAGDEIPKELQSATTTSKTFDVKKGGANTLNIEF